MLKPIKSILFATDLTPNCQEALNFTISVATRFQATIYMLYVIEKLPEHLTGRLKDLIGTHRWESLIHSHKMSAHKSLLGKQSTSHVIRQDLQKFCEMSGLDDDSCNYQSREIILTSGNIIEDILNNAETNECDLIVLGGRKNIFSKTSVGSTTKGVLKRSKIPVTVVPSVSS